MASERKDDLLDPRLTLHTLPKEVVFSPFDLDPQSEGPVTSRLLWCVRLLGRIETRASGLAADPEL